MHSNARWGHALWYTYDSDRAIEVNIQNMRAYGHLRPLAAEGADLENFFPTIW
jgi:hypothetical protein